MYTTYAKYRRRNEVDLVIYETRDGEIEGLLAHLDRKLDGWLLIEAKTVSTDLKKYPDIIPRYAS